jgi:hypothetical protein
MAIRLVLAVLLLGTATAHAQIGGAGGASPEATTKATQRRPIGAKRNEAPRVLKAPVDTGQLHKSAAGPAQPRPAKPPTRAAAKGR